MIIKWVLPQAGLGVGALVRAPRQASSGCHYAVHKSESEEKQYQYNSIPITSGMANHALCCQIIDYAHEQHMRFYHKFQAYLIPSMGLKFAHVSKGP